MGDRTIAATDDNPNMGMFALLNNGSKRVQRLVFAQYAMSTAWRLGRKQYVAWRSKIAYTLTIEGTDPLYGDIHTWLLSVLPKQKQHSLRVETSDTSLVSSYPGEDVPASTSSSIRFLFDGTSEQEVVLDGHRIKVQVTSTEGYQKRKDFTIAFTCYGTVARDAVADHLAKIAAARGTTGERLPRLYLATRWGDWDRRDELAARTPESVVLRAGVMDQLINDLDQFLNAEAKYVALGMPFHRGYMFHGPPGTGKSSVARALASHFGLDLYYLPLGDLESDSNLTQMISRVPKRSVLLLEDIDTFGIARKRDDGTDHATGSMIDPGASLSGLLNALDGMATPHGLIVMMTTNKRDVLDDALVRDFRINIDQLIDYLDQDQLDRLLTQFIGRRTVHLRPGRRVTAAQVLGLVFAHLDDKDEAVQQIIALCSHSQPVRSRASS